MQVIKLRHKTVYSQDGLHDKEPHHVLCGCNDEQVLNAY